MAKVIAYTWVLNIELIDRGLKAVLNRWKEHGFTRSLQRLIQILEAGDTKNALLAKKKNAVNTIWAFYIVSIFFLLNIVFAVSCIGKLGFNFTWFIHLPGCLLYSLAGCCCFCAVFLGKQYY